MKKIIGIIILFLFNLIGYSQTNTVEHVSIIDLIANGNLYKEKKLYIKGYFVDSGRYGRLFLNKEDAQYSIYANSLMINYDFFDNCERNANDLFDLNNSYISLTAYFEDIKNIYQGGLIFNIYYFSKLEVDEN